MDFIGDRTVRDLWTERVALSGGEAFLDFEATDGSRETYTYREFDDLIDRTARAFHDHGLRKGDTAAIHLPNCPAYLALWFAFLKLGVTTVHSNTDHTEREVNYTLDNADARLAVTEPAYADLVADAAEGTPVEELAFARVGEAGYDGHPTLAGLREGVEADLPDVDLDSEDDAQIIFTSGTTSDPKGVIHTHANLLWAGERAAKHQHLGPDDRMLTALPIFHVNAQTVSVLSSLTVGATLVLIEGFRASGYVDQLRRHDATVTSLIGTQVRALLAQPEREVDGDNDLREVFFAINVTDEEKERFEERFGVTLLNGYGLSEAMTIVTMAPIHGDRAWPSIGRPAIDRDVHLVDDDGTEVEQGEMGEIAVDGTRGRTLMKEYYRMPGRTEETFTEEGWLLTGDYGRFDERGNLYFVDRKKNIIETRGENVSEAEVEGVLESHPGVEEAGVIGVPHEIYGEAVKAFVKRTDGSLSEAELREYVEGNLARFKVPEEIEFVEDFPRTSVGKIEKSTLRSDAE